MGKVLGVFVKGLQVAWKFAIALWLAALYGLVGDIEGFDRWREWLEGRRD
jgi:hypothetical protein